MPTSQATQVREPLRLEGLCTIQKIRPVEIVDVVTSDNVRIHFGKELAPRMKHVTLVGKRFDMSTGNVGAGVERENSANEGLGFALNLDDAGDLNHGIDFRLREDTFATGALDIETQHAKRCHL